MHDPCSTVRPCPNRSYCRRQARRDVQEVHAGIDPGERDRRQVVGHDRIGVHLRGQRAVVLVVEAHAGACAQTAAAVFVLHVQARRLQPDPNPAIARKDCGVGETADKSRDGVAARVRQRIGVVLSPAEPESQRVIAARKARREPVGVRPDLDARPIDELRGRGPVLDARQEVERRLHVRQRIALEIELEPAARYWNRLSMTMLVPGAHVCFTPASGTVPC